MYFAKPCSPLGAFSQFEHRFIIAVLWFMVTITFAVHSGYFPRWAQLTVNFPSRSSMSASVTKGSLLSDHSISQDWQRWKIRTLLRKNCISLFPARFLFPLCKLDKDLISNRICQKSRDPWPNNQPRNIILNYIKILVDQTALILVPSFHYFWSAACSNVGFASFLLLFQTKIMVKEQIFHISPGKKCATLRRFTCVVCFKSKKFGPIYFGKNALHQFSRWIG